MLKPFEILCLENEKYYKDLGVFEKLKMNKNFKFNFNGIKKYKISDKEIIKYDIVISIHYTNLISNFIIMKAKLNNVKTLLIADGIMDWSNFFYNPNQVKKKMMLYHPIVHDYFWTVGNQEKKYFMLQGQKTESYLPKRVLINKTIYPLPQKQKVLITTANTAYFNKIEKESLIDLLKLIKNCLENKNVEVIYRIFDSELIDELNIRKEDNYLVNDFDHILKEVSVVITTPSSITLNSMFHERAVGQLLYRNTPLFVQSGWLLSKGYSIDETIDSLLAGDRQRMEFQKYQLKEYVEKSIDPDKELMKILKDKKKDEIEISNFVNKNLNNLLNSKTNINLEYLLKKIYLKMKGKLKIKKL